MRTHLTLSILAAAALGGCAPMGTSTFDCNRLQHPSSPSCVSFRGAVAGTDGAVPMTRFDRELRLSEADRRTNIAPPDAITDKASLPESVEDDLRRQSLRALLSTGWKVAGHGDLLFGVSCKGHEAQGARGGAAPGTPPASRNVLKPNHVETVRRRQVHDWLFARALPIIRPCNLSLAPAFDMVSGASPPSRWAFC